MIRRDPAFTSSVGQCRANITGLLEAAALAKTALNGATTTFLVLQGELYALPKSLKLDQI